MNKRTGDYVIATEGMTEGCGEEKRGKSTESMINYDVQLCKINQKQLGATLWTQSQTGKGQIRGNQLWGSADEHVMRSRMMRRTEDNQDDEETKHTGRSKKWLIG